MTRADILQDAIAAHALERAQQAATYGHFGRAEEYLAEVRRLVPKSHHVPLLIAKLRLRESRWEQCREALAEANRLGHDPAENASMRAWLEQHVVERAGTAIEAARRPATFPVSGAEVPGLNRFGTTRDALRAVAALRRYLERRPNCPVGLARLAESLTAKALHWGGSQKVLASAEATATRAVLISPSLADGHVALGVVHEVRGSAIDAERHLRNAFSRDPHHWYAHHVLGSICNQQGRYEDALHLLSASAKQRPDFIATYDHLYQARRGLGDMGGAGEAAREGIARGQARIDVCRDDLFSHAGVAVLHARIGNREAVSQSVERLTQLFPKSGCAWAHAALAHAVLGDAERAQVSLKISRERGFAVAVVTRRTEFDAIRYCLVNP